MCIFNYEQHGGKMLCSIHSVLEFLLKISKRNLVGVIIKRIKIWMVHVTQKLLTTKCHRYDVKLHPPPSVMRLPQPEWHSKIVAIYVPVV